MHILEYSHVNLSPIGWKPSLCVFRLQTASPLSLPALLLSNKTSSTLTPPTSDFLGFSDPSLRSGGGDSFSSPSFSRCLVKPSEVTASEGMASLSTFGSMMSLPGGVAGGKLYENSHSEPTGNVASTAGYKRPSSSSSSSAGSSSGPSMGEGGEEGVKKKRGNWRNRYGPCFSVPDGKATDGPEHHTAPLPLPSSSLCSTSSASPSPSSTSALPGRPGGGERGGLLCVGVSSGIQKSPSLLRNGSVQIDGVTSTPSGTGKIHTHKQPLSSLCLSLLILSKHVLYQQLCNAVVETDDWP